MERFCLLVVLSVVICLGLPTVPSSLSFCGALVLAVSGLALCFGAAAWRPQIMAQQRHWLQVCLLYVTALLLYPLQLSLQLEHDAQLLQRVDSQPRLLVGTIVGLPKRSAAGWQFFFKTISTQLGGEQTAEPVVLDVRWYLPLETNYGGVVGNLQLPDLKEGQVWQLELAVKPITAPANPSQGWREGNLWVQGVLLGAQVRYRTESTVDGIRQWPRATLLNDSSSIRQQVADGLARCCASYSAYPLWLALTLGERPFSAEMWQGLRNAGLNHILSISGMHIALVFQWCLLLGMVVRCLPLSHGLRVALLWCGAGTVATLYAWLAGFAIPTQRALWTLLLLITLGLLRRRASGWSMHVLLTAVMLLVWPALLLSVSFWFTVVALGLLIAMQWLQRRPRGWRDHCRAFAVAQLWFSIGLLPLSLLYFQGLAPWALLINLMLVPYIALLLFPALCLVTALQLLNSHWPLSWLPAVWQLLDDLFAPLLQLLLAMDAEQAWWSLPQLHLSELALITISLISLGFISAAQRCAVFIVIVLLLWRASDISGARVHVIDVGQGSATLLQIGHHGALLDVGPAVGDWSATEQFILPYLQYYRISQLDWVLLSHDDSDHTGNIALLQQRFPNLVLYADFRADALPCRQLPTLWRGVKLEVLWPLVPQHSDNESSCVVQVELPGLRWLLPGDLGAAEAALLTHHTGLTTDVLVLGHHGSKTSSSLGWLKQLQPRLTIASAGRLNRFGHPSNEVQARLQLLQIPLLTTAEQGAILFTQQQGRWQFQTYRQQRFPAWLEKLSQDAVSQHRNR